MANLFSRMKQTVEADLHDLLDKKVEKNPLSSLNHYLRESEKEVDKSKKLLERQYRLKGEFKRELINAREFAEKRARQAEVASRAGEHDLYQFASEEQIQYESRVNKLEQALHQVESDLAQLETKYEQMKLKLKDMHIKRLELMGRENIARAHYKMDRVLESAASGDQYGNRFTELEGYIDQLEKKIKNNYQQHTIDARIAQLEKDLENSETN